MGVATDTSHARIRELNRSAHLRNKGDARHRMNFIPLTVKRILHISSDNADMRTHGRQHNLVCVSLTCCLSIRLRYRKSADNLKH
jgi:hypothetical protein